MNTKKLALIIVFAALTVAMNLAAPKFPAPYAPFLYYQVWEIPIVVAFVLFGPRVGIVISLLNTLILLVVFPGALPTGPLYNLLAVLSMLLGIYAAYRLVTREWPKDKIGNLKQKATALTISTTLLGVTARVVVTTISNYFLIAQPSPVGFGSFFSFAGLGGQQGVIAFLPFSVLFNVTLALYTIPIGLLIAIAINSRLKV